MWEGFNSQQIRHVQNCSKHFSCKLKRKIKSGQIKIIKIASVGKGFGVVFSPSRDGGLCVSNTIAVFIFSDQCLMLSTAFHFFPSALNEKM